MIQEATAGPAEGNAPTTARLCEVLNRAHRVVIIDGSPDEADSADVARTEVTGAEIADLARLLAVVDGGTGGRCLCEGGPTITVHGADDEPIACWTLHHQSGLRGLGDCDADLRDGPALIEWLAERGLTGSREVRSWLAEYEAEQEHRRLRWIDAAPAGLRDAATEVSASPGSDMDVWPVRLRAAEARLAALVRHRYSDGTERVRVLLAWLGTAARESGGGLKWYDLAVEKQLLAEEPGLVLAALTTRPPSPAHLDGAAELFGSLDWTRAHGRQLPEPLRSTLIRHIQADGTDPMKFRMRNGTYGTEQSV